MMTFEDHPRIPNRTVARTPGGGHAANIIARDMGGHTQYLVRPYVRWIGRQAFHTLDDAKAYVRSCEAHAE